jgi:hypothetical protein
MKASSKKVRTTPDILKEQEKRANAARENALPMRKGASNALVADSNNPWLELGSSLQDVLGLPRLKFPKEGGKYAISENESIPLGTRATAHADKIELGWKRWENNQCTDTRWGRLADNFAPPPEDKLPDNEPIIQSDGTSRKPWQFSMKMPVTIMDAGRQTYDLTVTAKSAFGAIRGVSHAYGKRRQEGRTECPIVELKGDRFWSHNYHTWVQFPVLEIVGWAGPDGKPLSTSDDLGDAIPEFDKNKKVA